MIIIILLAALVVWSIATTILEVRRDGYRQRDTDWSRVADHDDSLQRAETVVTYR